MRITLQSAQDTRAGHYTPDTSLSWGGCKGSDVRLTGGDTPANTGRKTAERAGHDGSLLIQWQSESRRRTEGEEPTVRPDPEPREC